MFSDSLSFTSADVLDVLDCFNELLIASKNSFLSFELEQRFSLISSYSSLSFALFLASKRASLIMPKKKFMERIVRANKPSSGLLFNSAKVVFINAKIAFIFTSLTAVQVYDFHIFTAVYSPLHGFIWNQHSDQLPVGLLAQLVEHCTGIAEFMDSKPVQA